MCSRCLGALFGIALSLLCLSLSYSIWAGIFPFGFLLPFPSFLDWGHFSILKKGFGKWVNAATGALIGFSVPMYYAGIVSLSTPYLASVPAYLAFFLLVYFIFVRKAAPNSQKK